MPHGVRLSTAYNIIIRKEALIQRSIARQKLFAIMEVRKPLDEDEMLITFGPLFGEEATLEFTRRLETLGFQYEDDFFGFEPALPSWCELRAIVVQ